MQIDAEFHVPLFASVGKETVKLLQSVRMLGTIHINFKHLC
jgi:hypothetical protein